MKSIKENLIKVKDSVCFYRRRRNKNIFSLNFYLISLMAVSSSESSLFFFKFIYKEIFYSLFFKTHCRK